jgi:hypothetical protein
MPKITQQKTLMTDRDTSDKLKALSAKTGLSQAHIFRRLVAAAHARFEKEKSGAFLLAAD